jgi:hypothetical protein
VPDEPRRSRIWPAVGGALLWVARELLPEIIVAWQASQAGVMQPTSRKTVMPDQVASQQCRAGHRHRWGRT